MRPVSQISPNSALGPMHYFVLEVERELSYVHIEQTIGEYFDLLI